jgi:hypothetical protein
MIQSAESLLVKLITIGSRGSFGDGTEHEEQLDLIRSRDKAIANDLERWLRHDPGCGTGNDCDCGLTDRLREISG